MPEYYKAYDARYQTIHSRDRSWFSAEPTPVVAEVLERYAVKPSARMLEIGCGEGRDAAALLARGCDLLATDVSPEAIRWCRALLPEHAARFAVLDCVKGENPFFYDFIFAVAVLHMLVEDEDRKAFYRFFASHLNPRGVGLICTMGDGVSESRTDPAEAFALRERSHESGPVLVAATSYRKISFETFHAEIRQGGLAMLETGLTSGAPDYAELMYAVVGKA